MIQTKQSVFLALAVVLGVVYMFLQDYSWVLTALLAVPTVINVWAIFAFKRRMFQATLCLVSILFYLVWYVALIVYSKQVAPDAADFQLEGIDAFPAVCLVLTFMARRAIIGLEKWLKQMDRIR